jgi:dTDP-4-amino-4,6-dideoxygalactose transaminase
MTPDIVQTSPLAEYEELRGEIDAAVAAVFARGHYILGPEVLGFEREFAEYIGARHAIGLGSGTDALHLGLRAFGVGPGDEVVTTPHTAVATVAAIEQSGATPVLVDIEADTFNLDPRAVERALTSRTKAIVPVHLFGHPADLGPLLSIASSRAIPVLEDCAQAHGARYAGRRVGGFGAAAAFSFYPTKNLGAIGDGGMLVTSDAAVHERARALREYGWKERYVSEIPGWNSRLDEVQAAILRVKLQRLEHANERRRALGAAYASGLPATIRIPTERHPGHHVYHLYVVRHPRRDLLRVFLRERGIGSAIHYPVPVHLQPAYRGRLGDTGSFPVAEAAATQILSLPLYPQLAHEAVQRVVGVIGEFESAGRVRQKT